MAFQALKNFLRGKPSKLDNLERRIRRIEYELSKISFGSKNQRNQADHAQSKGTGGEKSIDQKRRELSKKGDTVYTERGWKMPKNRKARDIQNQRSTFPSKIGAKERLMLEFQCPQCGNINSRGIEHSHVEEINSHTDYHLYFRCSNCGWESDLVSIRATN